MPADAAIDYETHSNFTIDIQADSGDRFSGSIGITVSIENVDDEAPVFGDIPDIIAVETGTRIFNVDSLAVVAADDLGDEIEYAFLNDDGSTANTIGDFSIDSGTGAITVTTAPMYDTADAAANRRELTIQASDTSTGAIGDRVSTVEITILITPMSSLALQSSEGDTIAVDESDDTQINITTISVANPANATPYTILGGHAGFSIGDDGSVTASIDYESLTSSQRENGLSLIIQGEDANTDVGIIFLEITITNIDDEAPVFGAIPTGVTVEGGSTTLSAPTSRRPLSRPTETPRRRAITAR